MAFLIHKSDNNTMFLKINLLFWIFLGIGFLIFKPAITTLQIVNVDFGIPQWAILAGICLVVIVLNFIKIKKQYAKNTA